tara:strand:+ start:1201 stop:2886 length:1686 start_codon:yes stop_codon:yes gene_type:complete
MLVKKIKFILIFLLFYQSPLFSKSTTLDKFDSNNLSDYFSGIVAFENKDNSNALDFFQSSKILISEHDPYLKRYVSSLVLENKILQAINVVRNNFGKNNTNFFDAYLLLIFDSLKKKNFNKAELYLKEAENSLKNDNLNTAILGILNQYILVFQQNKIPVNKKNYGNLSLIAETFQRCYLNDEKTDTFFLNLINNQKADYTRYTYFYLSYLIENNKIIDAINIINDVNYINTTLLLAQGKYWIEEKNYKKFNDVFSCKNHNDVLSEFLFLVSNLYSSQDNYEKSNFYLNLSNYLNPKFKYNLSLVAENYYFNNEYKKSKKILNNFNKDEIFYYWYRVKKRAQIIEKQRNVKEAVNYIESEFNKISNPNNKMLFDLANFYRNAKEFEKAINLFTKVLVSIDDNADIRSDILYRRGSSYERIKDYKKADKDLFASLELQPDDAYVLNYLAYSWLERDYKIEEAIKMLEIAYESKSDDPYIIDSIGWAYYLVDDYIKAEKFLNIAIQLMPDDPIVSDHYGDILWKLDRKIQARYFWKNVLQMKDTDEEMIKNINIKLIYGLDNS